MIQLANTLFISIDFHYTKMYQNCFVKNFLLSIYRDHAPFLLLYRFPRLLYQTFITYKRRKGFLVNEIYNYSFSEYLIIKMYSLVIYFSCRIYDMKVTFLHAMKMYANTIVEFDDAINHLSI